MCPAHSLSHRLRRLRAALRTLASISVAARYRCRVQGICASMRNFSSRILQLDQESLKQTKIIYSQVAAAPMLSLTRFFSLQSNHMHAVECYLQAHSCIYTAFSALTLLVGRQEGHPACKQLSGDVLAWLSVWSEVQTCIWLS